MLDNTDVNDFTNIMNSYNFIPFITKPTRFPSNGQNSSLLDQIFINRNLRYVCGLVDVDYGDHLPLYVHLGDVNKSNYSDKKKTITFRLMSEENRN